jgi:hypothetical protein
MRREQIVRGLIAAALATLLAPAVSRAAGVLDGRTFEGVTREAAREGDQKEEIVFRDGKLHSLSCDPYGFAPGAYTAESKDGGISFRARTESAKEGVIEWQGVVIGDRMSATFAWTKKGQASIEYWVKATLKK